MFTLTMLLVNLINRDVVLSQKKLLPTGLHCTMYVDEFGPKTEIDSEKMYSLHHNCLPDTTCINIITQNRGNNNLLKSMHFNFRLYWKIMQTQTADCVCFLVAPHYSYLYLANVHSGFSDTDLDFQRTYELELPDVNMTCTRCCLLYLKQKGYPIFEGMFNFVFYPNEPIQPGQSVFVPSITAFVSVPKGGGKRGQIATGHDTNFGKKPSIRVFSDSRTYQLYSETKHLSVGFNAEARMESIAVDVVKELELKNIQVNYAAAVLIDRYREKKGIFRLNGCCCIIPPVPPPVPQQAMTVIPQPQQVPQPLFAVPPYSMQYNQQMQPVSQPSPYFQLPQGMSSFRYVVSCTFLEYMSFTLYIRSCILQIFNYTGTLKITIVLLNVGSKNTSLH